MSDVTVQPGVIEAGKGEPVVGAGGSGGAGGKTDAGGKVEGSKVEGGKAGAADPEPKPKPRAKPQDDDDDPEPDEKGFISLPQKQFAKKIANMASRELKRLFGTDDVDQILADRKEHQELKKEKQERDKKADEERRAQLKKEELLAEDNAKQKRRIEELDAALLAKDEERMVDKQENYLQGVAGKLIDEDSVDLALLKFRNHIKSLSNHAVEALTAKDVEDWFQDWTEKHPKHAKAAGTEKPKAKVAVDTATKKPGTKPVVRSGEQGQKRPMEMTPAEWAAEKKRRGISY